MAEANVEWMPTNVLDAIDDLRVECHRLVWKHNYKPSEHVTLIFELAADVFRHQYPSILNDAHNNRNEINYLKIEVSDTINKDMIEEWLDCFEKILNSLKNSPLWHFEINNLESLFYEVRNPGAQIIYNRIIKAIVKFLESQRRLRTVQIANCMFSYEDNMKILGILTDIQSIVHIYLECDSFISFRAEGELAREHPMLPLFNRLQNLQILAIDYSYVLGEHANPDTVLECIKSFPHLKHFEMFLRVSNFSINFKRFDSSQWRSLKEEKPDLYLCMGILTEGQYEVQNKFFIVNDIPLKYIYFVLRKDSPASQLGSIVQLLDSCGITDILQVLCLKLMLSNMEGVCFFLTDLVSRYGNLRGLYIKLAYPQTSLEDFITYLCRESSPSLKKIRLFFYGITTENERQRLKAFCSNSSQWPDRDFKVLTLLKTIEELEHDSIQT